METWHIADLSTAAVDRVPGLRAGARRRNVLVAVGYVLVATLLGGLLAGLT